MAWLSDIFAGGAEGILKGVSDIIKDFKPDPEHVLALQAEMRIAQINMDVALSQAQTKINEIEAGNNNIFIAGWRPAVGWVCVFAMGYKFLLFPFVAFGLTVAGVSYDAAHLPSLDWTEMSTVLFGMLGLGAMRSYEKTNGK